MTRHTFRPSNPARRFRKLTSHNVRLNFDRLETRIMPATFQGLGDVIGGAYGSNAEAVSLDGSVVAGICSTSTGDQAFRWTAATGMVALGVPPGTVRTSGQGVSGDGLVVVGVASPSAGSSQAFRWSATSGMVGMGNQPSDAVAASLDGSVIVGTSGPEAYRWTAATGMVGLGFLFGGSNANAHDVSADGSVIVGYCDSTAGSQAMRWTAAGGMVGLGFLPGAYQSIAHSVSIDGSVIAGVNYFDVPNSSIQAFRWTEAGGKIGLGSLSGSNSAIPSAMSADGSVIVGSSNGQAFQWTAAAGMRSVQDILITDYGLGSQLTGWKLSAAMDCSSDGRTIVGHGTNPGGLSEAWIARLGPPAPPIVVSVQINDGSTQRSMLTKLVVNFSEAVSLPNGLAAFQLNRTGPSGPIGSVSLNGVQSGNKVTLTFAAGGDVAISPAGSLADGTYQLTIIADKVQGVGGNLDANGDGTGGDNYLTPTSGIGRVYRLFGDVTGNGSVNSDDFSVFRSAFGAYSFAFDFDGDLSTDANDFAQFRMRFGLMV